MPVRFASRIDMLRHGTAARPPGAVLHGRDAQRAHHPRASVTVPAKVLVADDNVDAAVGLGVFLETLGYEVKTAHNGPAALELARRWHPEAIFLDISMPLIDGDEVCRKLREEAWCRDVLIAAVTGFGLPEDRVRSFEAGFDFHLVKPVDPRQIIKLLQSL